MLARYFVSFSFATLITFSIFYAMQILISQNEIELQQSDERIIIVLDKTREPEPTAKREQKPPEPIIELEPQVVIPAPNGRGDNPIIIPNETNIPIPTKFKRDTNFAISEGIEQPIFRVAPQYPTRMLENGIEGYVRVMFTVSAMGNVEDVKVIESSHAGFERNAIKAAEKFKYKPKVVDGIAVEVKGITNRIEFSLEK